MINLKDIPALQNLNEEELKIAFELLSKHADGNSTLLHKLYEADYRIRPATPQEFLDNPVYTGNVSKKLYPKWREIFVKLYTDPRIYYVILTGAIGIGKDYFSEFCAAYELHKIGCLKDPHKFYDRAENTDIVISVISITKTQTKNVFFNQLKSIIDTSDWFSSNFARNKDKNDIIEFFSPKDDGSGKYGKIRVMYGSPTNASVIGENVLIAFMDEANFMQVVEKSKKSRSVVSAEFDQAQVAHDNLLRRIKSRYMNQGKIMGKIFILSSRQYPDDFVERRIAEYKDDPHALVIAYSLWEAKPEGTYSTKTFKVLVGNERMQSRLLLDETELPPEGHEIIDVPIDFLDDFKRDLDGSIRDIAGRATLTVSNFLKQRNRLYPCFKKSVPHPFTAFTTTLDDGHSLDMEVLELMDKSAPRAIHLDLSSSECATGFAMVHVPALKDILKTKETLDELGNKRLLKVTETLPVYRTDLALQIVAPTGGEIIYAQIRNLIYQLRELGFCIDMITADQYQSKDTLQILYDNGFSTNHLSIDLDIEIYRNLRNAIYEDRFECADHPILQDELIHLEENFKKRKIEKKPNKSKDVSDAVAGACWALTKYGLYMSSNNMTPQYGNSKEMRIKALSPEESCELFEEDFTKGYIEQCFTDKSDVKSVDPFDFLKNI